VNWVKLAVLLLKFAGVIINYAERRRMLNDAKRQILLDQIEKARRAIRLAGQVEKETRAMTETDLDQELEKYYRD